MEIHENLYFSGQSDQVESIHSYQQSEELIDELKFSSRSHDSNEDVPGLRFQSFSPEQLMQNMNESMYSITDTNGNTVRLRSAEETEKSTKNQVPRNESPMGQQHKRIQIESNEVHKRLGSNIIVKDYLLHPDDKGLQQELREKNRSLQNERGIQQKLKVGFENSIEEIKRLHLRVATVEKEKSSLVSNQQDVSHRREMNLRVLENENAILKKQNEQSELKRGKQQSTLQQKNQTLLNNISSLENTLIEKDKMIQSMQQHSHNNEIKLLSLKKQYTQQLPLQIKKQHPIDNQIQQVVGEILIEFMQFLKDYSSSHVFPSIIEIHSEQFLQTLNSINENQLSNQSKVNQVHNFVQILLAEFEILVRTCKQLNQQTTPQVCIPNPRNNLMNVVHQKNIEELRAESNELRVEINELKIEINELRDQNQKLIQQQKIVQVKNEEYKYKQPQVSRSAESLRDFYRKMVETLMIYIQSHDMQSLVSQLCNMRESYEEKDQDMNMSMLHLQQLESELKVPSQGVRGSQVREFVDKHRCNLQRSQEDKSIYIYIYITNNYKDTLLLRMTDQMVLLKQMAYQEQQKMQSILRTQADYLRLKQLNEENEFRMKNMEIELKMMKQSTHLQPPRENKENNQLYFYLGGVEDPSNKKIKKLVAERDRESGITHPITITIDNSMYGIAKRTRTQSVNNQSSFLLILEEKQKILSKNKNTSLKRLMQSTTNFTKQLNTTFQMLTQNDSYNQIKVRNEGIGGITLRERIPDNPSYKISLREKLSKFRGSSILKD